MAGKLAAGPLRPVEDRKPCITTEVWDFELRPLATSAALASLAVAALPGMAPPLPRNPFPHIPLPRLAPRRRTRPRRGLPRAARGAAQFLAGGLAGAATKTLVAPLERVSCMLMAPAAGAAPGALAALRAAWAEGGLPAMYRGHAATLAKIAPASAVQFAVYHGLRDTLAARRGAGPGPAAAREGGLTTPERLAAGAAGGAAATLVTYPLEATRTMMSVAGGVPGNLWQAGVGIARTQGLGGLYRGFGATLFSDSLGSALGFTLYEAYTRLWRKLQGSDASPQVRGLLGAASAATVMTLTMPMEVVRRRLQAQGVPGRPVLYRGALHCARCIARKEGTGAFYVAALPGYLKAAPSIGGMYFLYELMMRRFSALEASQAAHAADAGANW
uniref:Mitochondrial substrate carrier family protein B n=2 Tax=Auxenochlorella protothecoides TaxID=3075 RepID=A0A1D2A5A8_AUXPR